MTRADLHVHTKYSNRPTNFFLKKLNAPESLTEPEAAYQLAKRRGMDFVTFTDSDTIRGCLELSHYADVFTGCETTVAFPDDDCKIKLLIYGLNERQLEKMLSFRGNIFSVRDYLLAENLFHAVAHPLEVLNSRLNANHIEMMLLLFDHFETRSGGRQARTNLFMQALLDALTPEFMHELEKKWNIAPVSERSWQKGHIGASNDYCGQYTSLTFTEVPHARTPTEFIEALRKHEGQAAGIHGTTISSAHSMYRVAFQFYQQALRKRGQTEPDILSLVLGHVLQPERPTRALSNKFRIAAKTIRQFLRPSKKPSKIERRLVREFINAYRKIPSQERLHGIDRDDLAAFDERLYALADRVIGRVSYNIISGAVDEFNKGKVGEALSLGAAFLPLQGTLGPYLYSYDKLNRDRELIADIKERFSNLLDLPSTQTRKVAWFSDTVTDVNGVSMTLHKMSDVAEKLNADLDIICSVIPEKAPTGAKFLNFPPVGEIAIPDYDLQKLTLPPLLQMIRHLEQTNYSEYVISTPGPVGLLAMYCAHRFSVPCRAIYHSDFPQHVRYITGDEGLENSAWRFMRWFYGKADAVYSPSDAYRKQLIEHGFNPERLFIFTRGTDLEFFNPRHRDEKFYEPYGISGKLIFLYTGRVSREKNLDTVIDAFLADELLKSRAALAILGDGPYLETLRKNADHPSIVFPGFTKGKALARAYASADVFVFPSTTDTYGNSVLEAQASGLPALVSDEGGPKEIITPDESGFVLPGYNVARWTETMRDLLANSEKRHRMAAAARARAATRDWTTAFREFWDENPYPPKTEVYKAKAVL